jgi:ketosteroid isomerase-like protein
MKRLYLFVLFWFILFSCNTENHLEKEKSAIIKVIEESTSAYKARDVDRLAEVYAIDSTTVRLNAGKYGFFYEKGWDEIRAYYKQSFKEHPQAITTKYEKKDWTIKVYGKSAIAFHDEAIYDSENEYQHHQIGVHFLEKVKGNWKILYLSYIDTSSYD